MTYLLQHIAFYALLSAPIWGPIYLFWFFGSAIKSLRTKPTPPRVYTPREIAEHQKVVRNLVAATIKADQGCA